MLYVDDEVAAWESSSRCVWSGPTGLVYKRSIKHSYMEESCSKQQLQSITRLFVNELKIRDANGEDIVEELCALHSQECKDITNFHRIFKYLDKKTMPSETR